MLLEKKLPLLWENSVPCDWDWDCVPVCDWLSYRDEDVDAYVATRRGCRGTGTRGRVKKGWSGFELAVGRGEGDGEPGAGTARGRWGEISTGC